MSLPATARYAVGAADGELGLVQELLNTKAAGGRPDLLGELDPARSWAAGVNPELTLTDRDLPRLRTLRAALARAVAGSRGPERGLPAGTVRLELDPDGTVTARPRGRDAVGWIAAAVLAAAYQAQRDGRWQRLKLCRKPACAVAFYDRSRNNAGAWHDVRTCGNVMNLRASRARRRSAGA